MSQAIEHRTLKLYVTEVPGARQHERFRATATFERCVVDDEISVWNFEGATKRSAIIGVVDIFLKLEESLADKGT